MADTTSDLLFASASRAARALRDQCTTIVTSPLRPKAYFTAIVFIVSSAWAPPLAASEPDTFSRPAAYHYFDPSADLPTVAVQSSNVSYLFGDQPTVTSSPTAQATQGGPFSYNITANNNPVSFAATGLPAGLTINSSTGLISGVPTVNGTFTITLAATNNEGETATGTLSLTISSGPAAVPIFYSLHSLGSDAMVNPSSGSVDDPIIPKPNEATLVSAQPAADKGLVADGVTPLLIEIDSLPAPNDPTSFTLIATVEGGSLKNGTLGDRLYGLHHPTGAASNFSQGGQIVLSSAHPTGFLYVSAIKSEDVTFVDANELSVTLSVFQSGFTAPSKTIQFAIRKPPVVLVHGFNSDSQTWSNAFLEVFRNTYPSDFIVPINYGVSASDKDPNFKNRIGSLFSLVHDLDNALQTTATGTSFSGWAMTRYDLVCHSQGGVLARMLCAKDDPNAFGVTAFKNGKNAYRGRFRRIVTIGSPQNGSTLEYYAAKVIANLGFELKGSVIRWYIVDQGLLQPKFDPFGSSIKKLNDPSNIIDPDAKFHAIIGSVSNTCPVLASFFLDVAVKATAVIPRGCDGVVDFDSARSEYAVGAAYSIPQTSHAPAKGFFGVSDASTETHSSVVSQHVVDVLKDAPTAFASFKLPKLLDDTVRAQIDAVAPSVKVSGAISVRAAHVARSRTSDDAIAVFNVDFELLVDSAEPMQGQPTWLAAIYGPNGVTSDGLSIQQDPNDPTRATIYFPSGVQGELVVYCSYKSTSGKLIVTAPTVVYSTAGQTSLKSISLEPNNPTVTVGEKFSLQIWGTYSNNNVAQLFESVNAPAHITSSNSAVIAVGADNQLAAKGAGTATVTVSFRSLSAQVTVTVAEGSVIPTFPTIQLANISTRLAVQTADKVLIGGFIVTGTQPKKVILRGIGSSLPLAGALADPVLELYNGAGQVLESNDNWGDSANKQAIMDTGIPPASSLESAIVRTLPAGNSAYTVILRGTNSGTGIGVVEAYDLDGTVDSRLANISTRGFVSTGDNVMIGGTIVVGSATTSVLVRAIGPSLASAGVSNALQDPVLELFDSNGASMALNDNWRDTQEAQVMATTIPPSDNRESAILANLQPGAYTAIVRGKNNSSGVALVEAYQLQ